MIIYAPHIMMGLPVFGWVYTIYAVTSLFTRNYMHGYRIYIIVCYVRTISSCTEVSWTEQYLYCN